MLNLGGPSPRRNRAPTGRPPASSTSLPDLVMSYLESLRIIVAVDNIAIGDYDEIPWHNR
jgi:hypothetical protein